MLKLLAFINKILEQQLSSKPPDFLPCEKSRCFRVPHETGHEKDHPTKRIEIPQHSDF